MRRKRTELKDDYKTKRHVNTPKTASICQEIKQNQLIKTLLSNNNFPTFFWQIEELYEAYCLQWRLRDGANKMVKAYTDSSGSKEARESLAEANKGYKEYTEVRGQNVEK